MVELRRASHCVYKIRYHMVLCVKYRKQLMFEKGRVESFKSVCLEIGKRYWFEFDALGADGDHVHVFVGAAPRYVPVRVMQIIKSITARGVFRLCPEVKRELGGGEFWSDGGYIGAVGEGVTADIIKKYIETQGLLDEKEEYAQLKLFEF